MPNSIKKRSKKAGYAPGTLVHIGHHKTDKAKITLIDYDQDNFQQKQLSSAEECLPFKNTGSVSWINIDGVSQVQLVQALGESFAVHPLVLEDIVNTDQRPKYEESDEYLFIVLKMIDYDAGNGGLKSEQVSLILGPNYVLSFQEREGDVFDPIRERLRSGTGRIRKMGADYLAYALIDVIVDNYFAVIEKMGEQLEGMEDKLLADPSPENLQLIHRLKRDSIFLRRAVWPLRELIGSMLRSESPLIQKSTDIFLRDVYDHSVQVMDTLENQRDILSGMLDIYLSSISNKMNEVMKVLTVIATIFIPLTFIAGIYGMNFKYMPELEWPWGYFGVLLVMAFIGAGMLLYFRDKKWL